MSDREIFLSEIPRLVADGWTYPEVKRHFSDWAQGKLMSITEAFDALQYIASQFEKERS